MKRLLKKSGIVFLVLSISIGMTFNSCTKEEALNILSEVLVQALASWDADAEQLDEIPQDLDIIDSTGSLPSSVDLTSKFPPTGDQGSYGTCVTWAVGYNLKTALNGIDKQWTTSQLSQAANQTSPKDLFWAIPAAEKGSDCNGTQFESAMNALISRGGASLATVPYTSLGNCGSTPPADWTTEAADNKLVNFRKIADQSDASSMTVNNFKAYLAQGRPIAFGAKLGDRFMKWNSDAVIDYDTYLNPGMQHAYHAMALAGYDDSRNAFRVINSWGSSWGDHGNIWVDYDFFVSGFCFAAFVAQNKSDVNISGNQVGSGNIIDGLDVMAWDLVDNDNPDSNEPLDRQITYNVYNSGTETVNASSRWSILYMYYNAYDANDYGILIHDYYTDEFSTVPGSNEYWSGGVGIAGSWWNYINVPSGKSVAAALYNDPDADFLFTYTMPATINGSYYLVLIADGFENLAEQNEDNNYFFYSDPDGKPFEFVNGMIQNQPAKKYATIKLTPKQFENTPYQTLVKGKNLNTYSPREIMKLVKYHKANGDLQQKALQYRFKSSVLKSVKSKI